MGGPTTGLGADADATLTIVTNWLKELKERLGEGN